MSIAAFLTDLRNRDIQIWSDGDQLRCSAPAGALTPDVRDQLRLQKAAIVEFLRTAHAVAEQPRAVVPLQAHGTGVPVFAIPGHNGDVFSFRSLVQHLGAERPFYGLQPPGLDGHSEPLESVEALAGYFAGQIREFQPEGSCVIAGYCAGGVVAYELAQQLQQRGPSVGMVVMFAGAYPHWYRRIPQTWQRVALAVKRVQRHVRVALTRPLAEVREYVAERAKRLRDRHFEQADPVLALRDQLKQTTARAVRAYAPASFDGRVCLIYPSRNSVLTGRAMTPWRRHVRHIEEHYGPDGCEGDVMLLEPHAGPVSEIFRSILSSDPA
ncbi:MAG TPA: alpha/beta fold hydrolase [Thermoanaerobaculia bacterium]|nr:alpha/beta fold hydrolase [Thermoanaerobaculia bacterium]